MATTYKLVMVFKDNNGSDVTFSYKNAQSEPEANLVNKVMNTIITNGDIFTRQPMLKKEAYVMEETRTDISLSE